MTCGIYKIENMVNKKCYIGQSINIEKRWKQHIRMLNNHSHHSQKLQNSWAKYGGKYFNFSIIEICEKEYLNEKEQYYIKKYNSLASGYNCNLEYRETKKYALINDCKILKLNLSVEEEGIYAKIRQKLIEDGSCRIYSVNKTWGEYAKEFKISRNRIKDIFESLMNKNLIYFENSPKEVLINPNYYGYGNYIKNDKAKKVFNIKTENDFSK